MNPAQLNRLLRKIHLYVSVFFAPLLLFYGLTGAIQVLHLHEARGGTYTPPAVVEEVADQLDLLLCMSVNPGWGGQSFIPAAIEKLEVLRALVPSSVVIEVDGGIDLETARPAAEAGAGWLVAGSAVFGSGDPRDAFAALTAAVS